MSLEQPQPVAAYDRWEELHAEARENNSIKVTRKEAMRMVGVSSPEGLTSKEYLLCNGNKLKINGETYTVHGYRDDGSDLEEIVNRLASSKEGNLLAS